MKQFDFYLKENNNHFTRETMSLEEAEEYAKEYQLTFKEVKS